MKLQTDAVKNPIQTKSTAMSQKKIISPEIEAAAVRLSGLIAIDPALDLGSNLNVTEYSAKLAQAQKAMNSYNQKLALADEARNDLERCEQELADLSRRILSGIGSRYGYDSNEYAKAGGTRKSDRKKSNHKVAATN